MFIDYWIEYYLFYLNNAESYLEYQANENRVNKLIKLKDSGVNYLTLEQVVKVY